MRRNGQRTRTPRRERENSAPSVGIADAPEEEQRNGQAGSQAKEEKQPPAPEQTFWELLATLGDRWQTEGLSLYCYRLWPITDNRNPERFLCKLQEAIDEDWLLKNFGSGKYWLVLNNGQGKHIRTQVSNPHNPDFPPRVAPQEVIESNPRNRQYFQVWAAKDGHSAATQRAESNGAEPANGSDGAVRELAGLVKLALGDKRKEEGDTVTKTLINWALAQKDKERADNSPTAVATLVKELKALLPSQEPVTVDPLAIVEKVMSIQGRGGTDLDKLWKIVEKAQGRREEPVDPIHTMKETVALFTEVRQLFKGETGAAAVATGPDDSVWERIAINLSGQAAPLLSAIPAIIGAFKGTPVAVPTPGGARPAAPAAFNPFNPSEMKAFMEGQKAAASAPPPRPETPAANEPAQPATEQPAGDAALVQVASLVSQGLSCLNRGVDGHQAAAAFIDLSGELAFDSLAAQIKSVGIPVVLELAKSIPELKVQVMAYEGPLRAFVAEFAEGPQWDEEERKEAV